MKLSMRKKLMWICLVWYDGKKHFQYYFGQCNVTDCFISSTKLGQAIVIQDLRGVYSEQTRGFGKEAQILQYVFKQWLLIFAIINNYSFLLVLKFVDKIYCYNWTSKSTVKVNIKRMKDLLFCVYAVARTLNLKMSHCLTDYISHSLRTGSQRGWKTIQWVKRELRGKRVGRMCTLSSPDHSQLIPLAPD